MRSISPQIVGHQPQPLRDKGPKKVGSSGSWDSEPFDLVIPQTVSTPASPQAIFPRASAEINRFEQAEANAHKEVEGWMKTATKVGTAVGLGALSLAGTALAASPAQAATPQVQIATVTSQSQVRNQAPVRVSSPTDAVENFSAENQLYVIGNPQMNGQDVDLSSFSEALRDHPNVYVVINGNYVEDLEAAETDLGYGIGNHSEFMGVKEELTGERNGVLFFINLNVNRQDADTGRATLMRTEGLPDQLGVGDGVGGNGRDAWFPNGQPGELGSLFVRAVRDQRKDLGSSMEMVFEAINGRVAAHAESVHNTAVSRVNAARGSVASGLETVAEFQEAHGTGGELGSPDVERWRSLTRQAEEAFESKDFARLQELSAEVVQSVTSYQSSARNYGQAGTTAEQLQQRLQSLHSQLDELPENRFAEYAHRNLDLAQEHLEDFQISYDAKSGDYQTALQQAHQSTRDTVAAIEASHDAHEQARQQKLLGATAVSVALLVTAAVTHYKAQGAGKKAKAELAAATEQIENKSQALISLMESSDYNTVANYTGETKALADELTQHSLTALTLIGGTERFLEESKSLVEGGGLLGKVRNLFSTRGYNKASELLKTEEEGAKLKFETRDSTRAILEQESKAESWREQILKAGDSRQFESSLMDVLNRMGQHYEKAKGVSEVVSSKGDQVLEFVQGSKAVSRRSLALRQSGLKDGLFTLPSVAEGLESGRIPKVVGDNIRYGDKSAPVSDPIRAHREMVQGSGALMGDVNEIVELGVQARETLVPALERVDGAVKPHGISTDWAHQELKQLSEDLDEAVSRRIGLSGSVDHRHQMKLLRGKADALGIRLNAVVDIDSKRRVELPVEMERVSHLIESEREQLLAELQARGAFRKGTPDQMLREPERDPSALLNEAGEFLSKVPTELNQGDVDTAGNQIFVAQGKSDSAERLVQETRRALESHNSVLTGSQEKMRLLSSKLDGDSKQIMERLAAQYESNALKDVAFDAGAGDTVADNRDKARELLRSSNELMMGAVQNFDRAHLLTARDQLAETGELLQRASGELNGVRLAESLLLSKQSEAEKGLGELQDAIPSLTQRVSQVFVRPWLGKQFAELKSRITDAQQIVEQPRKSPYQASKAVAVAQKLHLSLGQRIESEKKVYEDAGSKMELANKALYDAEFVLGEAETWAGRTEVPGHSDVVTSGPSVTTDRRLFGTLQRELVKAENHLNGKNYEECVQLLDTILAKTAGMVKDVNEKLATRKSMHSVAVTKAKEKVAAERRRAYTSYSSGRSYSSSSSSSSRSSGSIISRRRVSGPRSYSSGGSSSSGGSFSWGGSSSSSSSRSSSRRSSGGSSGGFSSRRSSGGSSGGFSSRRRSGGSSGSW